MKFDTLPLCEPLLRSLKTAGYETATPIQHQAIPPLLEGRDMIGCAQTGTGKTAAFALPTLQQLMESADEPTGKAQRRKRSGSRPIRSLILAPTRELASQIRDSLANYGRHTGLVHTVIFGGVSQSRQVSALRRGVDILVATPGRLLDLVNQGYVKLEDVEILILDEADQMLDMGFIPDLRKIINLVPNRRQTLMFSATMPKAIRKLTSEWLTRPYELEVAPVASTPERVSQAVYFVERNRKAATLKHFLTETARAKTLVFSRTRRGADKIVKGLERDGIRAVAIHGDKSQAKRQAVIRLFNGQNPPVLVATDLASRGLDFSDISHVINYDMPDAPETYVHRIGRTARAGASGEAVSFCGRDERGRLRDIERLTGLAVTVERMEGVPDSPPSHSDKPQNGYQKKTYSRSAKPGNGKPRSGKPDAKYSGGKSSGPGKSRYSKSGSGRPSTGKPGAYKSGASGLNSGSSSTGSSSTGNSSTGNSSTGNSGSGNSGSGNSGTGISGTGNSAAGSSENRKSQYGNSGSGNSGSGNSGSGSSNSGKPRFPTSGTGNSGAAPQGAGSKKKRRPGRRERAAAKIRTSNG